MSNKISASALHWAAFFERLHSRRIPNPCLCTIRKKGNSNRYITILLDWHICCYSSNAQKSCMLGQSRKVHSQKVWHGTPRKQEEKTNYLMIILGLVKKMRKTTIVFMNMLLCHSPKDRVAAQADFLPSILRKLYLFSFQLLLSIFTFQFLHSKFCMTIEDYLLFV